MYTIHSSKFKKDFKKNALIISAKAEGFKLEDFPTQFLLSSDKTYSKFLFERVKKSAGKLTYKSVLRNVSIHEITIEVTL